MNVQFFIADAKIQLFLNATTPK